MNKILVVEDEKLIRQGIISMIRRSGIPVQEIWEASNGEAALELIGEHKFDVIFTDIRMPRVDGLTLAREVQKMAVPPVIIAISGYDEFNYVVEMLRSGVREYILKPIERDVLVKLLGQLEEEINRRAEQEQGFNRIGYQQLKYWMLNDNMTAGEIETLIAQYGEWFWATDYVVCCTNNTKGITASGEHHIYLSDVGAHELYIMEEENTLPLLEQLLQGRYVGISARHHNLRELKDAFWEAAAARREAFWRNQKIVLFQSEEGGSKEEIGDKKIQQIVQQMGTDQEENARRWMNETFYQGRRGGYQTLVMEKTISLLLGQLQEMYGSVMDIMPDAEDLFGPIYVYPCAERLEQLLNQWLDKLSEKLQRDFDNYRNKQKIKQAILYIHEHYNTDLNMAVVSNAISMNYSLFSYTFKLYTGSKFVDYIKEVRIKEARNLLETTELKVNEISQRIGYDNEKHFMKIFKLVCGVSPTEYRKNMRHREKG